MIQYGDWHFPFAFYIEISEHCNRSCWYCPNAQHTRWGKMSDDVFTAAVRRLKELNWRGGVGFHNANEPLLDPRFFDMLSQLMSAVPHCQPCLTTNGDALTMEKAERMFDLGMSRIVVSRHEPFTPKWDDRIGAIIKRWPGRVQLLQVGKTIAVHTNGQFGHKGLDWQGYCIAPTLACVIDINGNVTLCCCDYYRKIQYGNVLSHPLRDIWMHPEFVKTRELLRQGKRASIICDGCSGVI